MKKEFHLPAVKQVLWLVNARKLVEQSQDLVYMGSLNLRVEFIEFRFCHYCLFNTQFCLPTEITMFFYLAASSSYREVRACSHQCCFSCYSPSGWWGSSHFKLMCCAMWILLDLTTWDFRLVPQFFPVWIPLLIILWLFSWFFMPPEFLGVDVILWDSLFSLCFVLFWG